MLSVKQGGIKYHFLTQHGIEPRPLKTLANTLANGPEQINSNN